MLVRLTKKGNGLFDHDRLVVSVSNKRAFTLMNEGYANPDRGFMERFAADEKAAAVGEVEKEPAAEVKSRRKRASKNR